MFKICGTSLEKKSSCQFWEFDTILMSLMNHSDGKVQW